jgi:hypothetical protein
MPRLGDPLVPLERRHIVRTNALMFLTACLAMVAFIGMRVLWLGWK